jgi:hypothetical protein
MWMKQQHLTQIMWSSFHLIAKWHWYKCWTSADTHTLTHTRACTGTHTTSHNSSQIHTHACARTHTHMRMHTHFICKDLMEGEINKSYHKSQQFTDTHYMTYKFCLCFKRLSNAFLKITAARKYIVWICKTKQNFCQKSSVEEYKGHSIIMKKHLNEWYAN